MIDMGYAIMDTAGETYGEEEKWQKGLLHSVCYYC